MKKPTGLGRAVEAAGSVSALARKVGVAQQVMNRWVRRGDVPAPRALEIEVMFGIPARELVKPSLLEIAGLILPQ